MIRRLLDRLRWRTITAPDIEYAAAGDLGWVLVRRRWPRRTLNVQAERDEWVGLAEVIAYGETSSGPAQADADGPDGLGPSDSAPEAAEERSGGRGWSRESIEVLTEQLRRGMATDQVHADQVEALLGERDMLQSENDLHIDAARRWHAVAGRREKELVEARTELDRLRRRLGDSIDPATIPEQRAKGWPDWHPEDYCHRCGRPNISWYADSATWNEVHGGSGPIWCPVCFALEHQQVTGRRQTWRLAPSDLADEQRHLIASEAAMRQQRDAALAKVEQLQQGGDS